MNISNKVKTIVFNITGYLILLVQQIPPMGVWIPLMAAPVFLYLTALVSNLPTGLIEALQIFVIGVISPDPFLLLEQFLIIIGLVITVYSIIYLGVKKRKTGLVTSGPYRFVRHPQYTGFLLLTIGFTGWSHFLITAFWGIGWIPAEATVALWYLELFAYLILAFVEEKYLSNQFGSDYNTYKDTTSFFIPLPKTAVKYNVVISIGVFSFLLFGVIQLF